MTQVAKVEYLAPEHAPADLETHAKNIRLYHDGARRGAAELYGYAYLCGREMLLAKPLIAHGNKSATPEGAEAGFKKWIEDRFGKDISYRTAAGWMTFAKDIQEKSATIALFNAEPKLLEGGKLSEKDCEAVLKVIPQIMDGKSMTAFMRDSKLARDPEQPKHTPAKKLTPDEEIEARAKQAHAAFTDVVNALTFLLEPANSALWIDLDDAALKQHACGLCVRFADKARKQKSKRKAAK
jgi:hypothetical protein